MAVWVRGQGVRAKRGHAALRNNHRRNRSQGLKGPVPSNQRQATENWGPVDADFDAGLKGARFKFGGVQVAGEPTRGVDRACGFQ